MRIIIAPAKNMLVDTDSFPVDGLPRFLDRTERLKAALQAMSPQE
ncbi:MAG: YaaA family protein, partial [Oscillibacter sp.]|nr:YaaA family protein [Oscillibacter sp.]